MRRPLQAEPARTTATALCSMQSTEAQHSTAPGQTGLSLVYFESISYEGCCSEEKQAKHTDAWNNGEPILLRTV